MIHTGRTIIRNASFMGLATTAQKVLSFLYFAAIARMIGAADTGLYFYALSLSQILSVAFDGGFANYIVRETARDSKTGIRYTENALGAKIAMMGAAAVVIFLLDELGWLPVEGLLLSIAAIVVAVEALQVTIYSHLRGLQKIGYEAMAVVISQIVTVAAGALVLWRVKSVPLLLAALLLASMFHLVYSYGLVRRFTGVWIRPRFDWNATLSMLTQCWPFALAAVFVKMIAYTDTVVIGAYFSKEVVGFYSVPYKLTYSFQFIPLALIATLYPAMSHLFHKKSDDLAMVLIESVRLLTMVASAIGFGIAAVAPRLIPLIYGAGYEPSIAVAQVLPLILVVVFAQYPFGALLNGSDHQRFQTGAMGLAMIVNVAANLLLVPPFGMMGAVGASMIANGVLLVASVIKAYSVASFGYWRLAGLFTRSIAAGSIMVIVVRAVLGNIPLIASIAIGAAVFIACSIVFGLVTRTDLARLARAFGKTGV